MDTVVQLNAALAGRYAVEREVGAGGMATVYLARDARHDRPVALKVLNPELGAVLGVERFLAEIKVTANLQHPNLLPLFDSGTAEGLLFYVMPFVEGESLRARLDREKQLPVEEAVQIATAVAGALAYAHRHGVIHRDLKPENILLHEGQPLVADFGIALAVSNAGGNRITQTGLSLGTPQYMSPEQASGDRVIDGRTDIYSLATVLYEMLVGDPPHLGGTSQAIIAKLLTDRARPVRISRPSVPVYVDTAVDRGLEKLPADRFATAQEFAEALAGKGAMPAAASASASTARPARFGVRDAAYAAALVAAIAFGVVEWRRANNQPPQPVVRMTLTAPKDYRINDALNGTNLAVSPQGDLVVFYTTTGRSGGGQLYSRTLDQIDARPLPTTIIGGRTPTFSPDGRWLALTIGSDVVKVSVDGGPLTTLATIPDQPAGVSWGSHGSLVVGSFSGGLYVVPERGGAPHVIPKLEGERGSSWPLILPDGETVVFASNFSGSVRGSRLNTVSISGRDRTPLELPGSMPLGYLAGQLVYVTEAGALMAAPFDLRHRRVTGPPTPVGDGIVMNPTGGAKAALSPSGTLVYRSGKSDARPVLVSGTKATPTALVSEARDYTTPRFSPDGGRVAFTVSGSGALDVWVFDRRHGTLTRLTTEGSNSRPEWTADGKRILFVSDRGGQPAYWWQPADGSGPAELLYKPEEGDPFEGVLSPDGQWLVYRTGPGGKPPRSIFAVRLDGKSKSIPLVTGASYIQMPRLSPDGRWLAYQSNETGAFEIYVRPFPGSGGRVQVSAGGGTEPLWARSGRTLYYRSGQDVVGVAVTTGTSFSVGERRVVITGDYLTNPSHQSYDVAPDGSGFLMISRAGEEVETILVHNWVRELIAKTSAPR